MRHVRNRQRDDLGGALAGRPIMIRYVDNRELAKPAADPSKPAGNP